MLLSFCSWSFFVAGCFVAGWFSGLFVLLKDVCSWASLGLAERTRSNMTRLFVGAAWGWWVGGVVGHGEGRKILDMAIGLAWNRQAEFLNGHDEGCLTGCRESIFCRYDKGGLIEHDKGDAERT